MNEYEKYITGGVVIDVNGKVIADGEKGKDAAFQTNIRAQYKDKNIAVNKRTYPMFTQRKKEKHFTLFQLLEWDCGDLFGEMFA